MKSYLELINKSNGKNVFILGAGTSLWYNMQNPLFDYIHTYGTTIAVNSTVMADVWYDYWLSNDALNIRCSWWDMVKKGKGKKIVRNSWIEKHKDEIEDFYIFEPRKSTEGIIDVEDEGLCYCSSVVSSLDFSIKCGFKNIFLLGVDQCLDKKTGYHHFWQFLRNKSKQIRPVQGSWNTQTKVFKYNNLAYKALKNFAEYKKCKIYNISYMVEEEYKKREWMTEVKEFEIINSNQIEKIIK